MLIENISMKNHFVLDILIIYLQLKVPYIQSDKNECILTVNSVTAF